MAGYAVYNYAFYLFGAALNVFFPLYVVSFLVGILTLGRLLSHLDVTVVADSGVTRPCALLVATSFLRWDSPSYGLACGERTPSPADRLRLNRVQDRRRAGPLADGAGACSRRRVAVEAAILGLCDRNDCRDSGRALPLVLSVNSAIAIQHGLVSGPGELLIWGPLTISTTIAAVVLFRSASGTSNLYQRGANT